MAVKPQIKANQLAKDLNLKSKDIVDIMAEKGIELKTQKSLEPHEFNVLFDALTSAHQIEGIDDYIDGVTFIPSKLEKAEKQPEAEVSAPVAQPVEKTAEEKSAVSQKTEKADKGEKTNAAEKSEKLEKPVKTEKAAPAEGKTPVQNTAPKSEPVEKPAEKPAEKAVEKPVAKTESVAAKTEPVAKDAAQKKPEAAQAPIKTTPKVDRAEAIARAAAIEKAAQEKAMQRAANDNRQKNDNNNRKGDGQPHTRDNVRPDNRQERPDNRQDRGFTPNNSGAQRPQAQNNDRFSKMATPDFERQSNPQRRDDRKPQKPQFNNNRGGMGMMDKDDYVPSAPREKFQPQAIVRAQTPKGGDGTSKKGAAKTVDIRTSSVDLSKYDEKLDTFVSEDERDLRNSTNQKLKKQQNQTRGENTFQKGKAGKKGGKPEQKAPVTIVKGPMKVQIPEEIMVSDLAAMLKVTVAEVIKKLLLLGVMATANQTVDFDTAALVAVECGAEPEKAVVVTIEEKLFDEAEDTEEQLVGRAPVVCVMGHVDHGKTSLLDAIRHTNVTTGEAGGITQHIGAYRVKINGQDITFLDTPGHEAFTAMRARGAQSTDIAILVVAADDGIMPQTVEAINHAKAAGIDIIVAINKMDKPTANPDAIKQELTKYDLVPEEWGGDVICVPVSALTRMGIEDLLENVLLVAEVKELKANPNRRAKGLVIEAKLDRGRGPVATVLVQNGTLRNGDIVIAGTAVGRVRAMTDHNGKQLKVAGPSVPVEIIGLAEVPTAGDEFAAVEDERMARELADQRKDKAKEETFKANARANLNDLFAQISEGIKDLNIIVKADVVGSAEAVKASLVKLSNEEVRVNVIHSAVGGITENDVMFAAASNAIIVGFNVRPDKAALDSAERQGVDMRTYRIIYQCIEEIEAAMKGMLAPKFRENLLGHAEVRQTIHVPGVGTIAGSYILDGKISRNAQIRVVRDGIVIFEDKISSLKRFKDDAKEVAQGYECGVGLEKFNDIKEGDILEAFVMEEIER
ncbi:MAG: translation initiation factor IF-2 [Clostridia bacterium]|nr:translation initiation factor IF-2 [Clostridia bacterium]